MGAQRACLRRGLGQHTQLDVGDVGRLPPIAGVCLEHHGLLRGPRHNLVGTGAHRLVGQRVCHRRVDHGAPGVSEVGEHGHIELRGGHLYSALVNSLEGVAGILALARRGVVLQALERCHDGLGVAGIAVGEHKALAQLEGGDHAVLGSFPRLGKAGHKLAGRRHLEQRVVHVARNLERGGSRSALGIEAVRVDRDAHDELVGLSRRILRGGRRILRLIRTARLSHVRVLRAAPGKREQTGARKQAGTRKRASRQERTRRFRSSRHHNTFLKNEAGALAYPQTPSARSSLRKTALTAPNHRFDRPLAARKRLSYPSCVPPKGQRVICAKALRSLLLRSVLFGSSRLCLLLRRSLLCRGLLGGSLLRRRLLGRSLL